jgi:hypothetical protein
MFKTKGNGYFSGNYGVYSGGPTVSSVPVPLLKDTYVVLPDGTQTLKGSKTYVMWYVNNGVDMPSE